MFFIWFMLFTLAFDSVVMYFRFKRKASEAALVVTAFAGFLSFMLQYIGAYIFIFEFGKVELLKRGRKVFSLAFSLCFFCEYLFFVAVFYPLTLLIKPNSVCHIYFAQLVTISALSVLALVII